MYIIDINLRADQSGCYRVGFFEPIMRKLAGRGLFWEVGLGKTGCFGPPLSFTGNVIATHTFG